jgi:hypothetical protein
MHKCHFKMQKSKCLIYRGQVCTNILKTFLIQSIKCGVQLPNARDTHKYNAMIKEIVESFLN